MCLRAIRWIGVSASGAMRTGLKRRRRDPQSLFLPFSELNVLLGVDPEPTLGWLLPDAIPSDSTVSTPTMLGMMDGSTRFAIEVNEDAAAFIEDWTEMPI